ncbi:MAG TPA: carboxypeptidase-like regulatory domain-containing protein [Thermoanaerobaculia bacterium]
MVVLLLSLLVIRGVVVDPAGKPVAQVRVTALPAGEASVTKTDGTFALEPAEWPEELLVARTGLGTRRVAVPPAQTDVVLPPIVLKKAATVRVRVHRGADDAPLIVRIAPNREEADPQWLGIRRLGPKETTATFTDLDAGAYTILLEGDQPLKRMSGFSVVAAGDTRTVEIQPKHGLAEAHFTVGGKPLANAEITLTRAATRWETTLKTDAGGAYHGVVWERGDFDVSVRAANVNASFAGRVAIPDAALARFGFDVADRRIRGRVVDAKGNPVPNAQVALRMMGNHYAVTRRARTSDDGRFAYDGVYAGPLAIRVNAPRYLRPAPTELTLGEDDRERDVTIVLADGYARTLQIVDTHGTALGGATILCASGPIIRSMATTGADGRASIGTPIEEGSTLYIVPREGSLAIRTIAANDDREALRIVVPPANASLNIETLTTDGAPLPEVSLLMRVNGEVVPPEVAREMNRHQGVALLTNENGIASLPHIPAGVYEFWPYRTDEEAANLIAAADALAAPINVNVQAGENHATVRFQKKRY